MKLEVSLKEVQTFLFNLYHITIRIKSIAINKIQITYFFSFVLTIKALSDEVLVLQYDTNTVMNIAIKCVHFFMRKKLEKLPIVWNSKTREVIINLKNFKELDVFFKYSTISKLSFIHETIWLEVAVK